MTLSEITKKLADAGIESARHEALVLIEAFEHVPRSRAIADFEADYTSEALISAVERRATRYPLQYILGEWEFCGLTFHVDENCLIPRPDTEILVEAAVRAMPKGGRLLDLCTGSGCVACAVLSMTDGSVTAAAVELMHGTAKLARRNVERLGLAERCRVIEADLRDDVPEGESFDVITANPPYISTEEMLTLEAELSFEPRVALTDEGDGLSLYEDIIRIYKDRLKPGGVMLLEHGYTQAEAVRKIALRHGMTCETLRDLAGNARVAMCAFGE